MITYVYADTKFCISTREFIKNKIAANTATTSSIMQDATISITITPTAPTIKPEEKKSQDTKENKTKDKKSQQSTTGKVSKWFKQTTSHIDNDAKDTIRNSGKKALNVTSQGARDAYENLQDMVRFLPEAECVTEEQQKLLLNPSTQISKARACMWQGIAQYNQK